MTLAPEVTSQYHCRTEHHRMSLLVLVQSIAQAIMSNQHRLSSVEAYERLDLSLPEYAFFHHASSNVHQEL